MSNFAPAIPNEIAEKDVAETFGESDVTVRKRGTKVSSQSLVIGDKNQTSPSAALNNGYSGGNRGFLVRVSESYTVTELHLTIPSDSDGTYGTTNVEIVQRSDGTILASDSNSYYAGDTCSFTGLTLDAPDGGGDVDYIVRGDPAADFIPYTDSINHGSAPWDFGFASVPSGWDGSTTGRHFALGEVNAVASNALHDGSAHIEWPQPNDVYRWDAAAFQRTLDSETVDVYVEEYDGTSGITIAGPIGRGQEITADPSRRCRFRVELERADTANNPTLDAIARRWVI